MINARSIRPLAQMALGLSIYFLISQQALFAQSVSTGSHILVVVADPSDAACVKRIAGGRVHVECLSMEGGQPMPDGYSARNRRALGLINFGLFICRSGVCAPEEEIWHERLKTANPRGAVHQTTLQRPTLENERERSIQQATSIHRALSTILPIHQALLDANLMAELQRLQSPLLSAPLIVASD